MNRNVEFINRFGAEFWLDQRLTGLAHARMVRYIRDQYAEEGSAALRETPLSLHEFRSAAGGALDDIDDQETYRILRFAVARISNCAHLLQIAEGSTILLLRIVAVLDDLTSPLCKLLDGTFIRTRDAVRAVPIVIEKPQSPSISDIAAAIGSDKVIADGFVRRFGFPPFHRRCRTRITGVVPGVSLPMTGREQAKYDEWRRNNPGGEYVAFLRSLN